MYLYLLLCLSVSLGMWVCPSSGTQLDVYVLSNAQKSSRKGGAIHLSEGNLHQDRGDGFCDAGEAHSCWWEALIEGNFGLKSLAVLKTEHFNLFFSPIYTVLFFVVVIFWVLCFVFFLTPPVCQKLVMAKQG